MRTVASRKALLLHEWARPLVLKFGPVRDVVECAKETASVDVWRRHCEHNQQTTQHPTFVLAAMTITPSHLGDATYLYLHKSCRPLIALI
jgi:hypothetical protein